MAMRRRSAEHVVRYACLIQLFFNALIVLKSMDQNIIKYCGDEINESFEIEARNKVNIHS
jgi:hypothetical protein